MSGYREHGFDPNAGGDYGPPLRPYNWVQWTGVAFFFLGLAAFLAYFAGRLGLIPKLLDSPVLTTSSMLVGVALINSRRELASPSPGTRRRRMLIVTVALAVSALTVILVYLDFKGA
jgi:hypothetical protein